VDGDVATGPVPSKAGGARLLDLLRVMHRLRSPGGCPWDAEQTHRTLARHLLEETHETLEAIDAGDMGALRDELGDLLLQVVFHAEMAMQAGDFDVDDVAEATYVLETEIGRVVEVDVGLRCAVDEQQPTGGPVGVGLDGDARGYSWPLVDGMPVTRPSSVTASRSARATPLNCASTTWWALRPASTRTCRQICALATNDSQM
jgi:NTP pyrophosphatase (non-canonical NTP hydrolase)